MHIPSFILGFAAGATVAAFLVIRTMGVIYGKPISPESPIESEENSERGAYPFSSCIEQAAQASFPGSGLEPEENSGRGYLSTPSLNTTARG